MFRRLWGRNKPTSASTDTAQAPVISAEEVSGALEISIGRARQLVEKAKTDPETTRVIQDLLEGIDDEDGEEISDDELAELGIEVFVGDSTFGIRSTAPRERIPLTDNEALPAGSFKFVAVDVETANANVGSICQLGLACVDEAGRIAVTTLLINPQAHFDTMNINIHGIRPKDVAGKPTFDCVLEALKPLLEKNHLVQHSAFDGRAIRTACQDYELPEPDLHWYDSVTIARRAWPELKGEGGHGLANLKKHLGLEFEHHDAGEDARAAAEVVLRAEGHTGLRFTNLASRASSYRQFQPAVKMEGLVEGPLFGQVAVFTGSLSLSRTDAAKLAAEVGITTKTSVSKKVTLLIVGDQDLGQLAPGQTKSSKHRKAEELIEAGCDIRVLGETEFKRLVTES